MTNSSTDEKDDPYMITSQKSYLASLVMEDNKTQNAKILNTHLPIKNTSPQNSNVKRT